MKQNNYKVQAGCHDCKHVCEIYDYDSGSEFFCNVGINRPLSGSCAMNESFNFQDNEHYKLQTKAWDKWSEANEVCTAGICNLYTRE